MGTVRVVSIYDRDYFASGMPTYMASSHSTSRAQHLPELRQSKLPQLASGRVPFPNILRPKRASVHVVFEVIPNNVRLLQKKTHAGTPRRQ